MDTEENLVPDPADSWADQATDLLVQRQFDEAARCFRKALKYRPNDSFIWYGLGLALLQAGNYQGTVRAFDKALRIWPLADYWKYRAEALLKLGRYQEAVESYEKAIEGGMNDGETQSGRMEALTCLEKYVRERTPKLHLETYELIAFIEERLHLFVRQRLKQAFGEEDERWWDQGVPLNIRKDCAQRREEDRRKRHPYTYIYLIDLKEILDKNWKHFEVDFRQVKGQVKTKKDFLDGLVRINEIRKQVMHPVRGEVTQDDLEFARQMRDIIENFTALK